MGKEKVFQQLLGSRRVDIGTTKSRLNWKPTHTPFQAFQEIAHQNGLNTNGTHQSSEQSGSA